MRWLLINHIQNAHESLHGSRVRSVLTMLGVTIGVASITTILALGAGATHIIDNQIKKLDNNIIIVRPGKVPNSANELAQAQPNHNYMASTLTESDIDYIKNIEHIKEAAPLMILSGTIKGDSTAPNSSQIVATTPNLATISRLKVKDGQFLDEKVAKNTAVIGVQLSINTFGTEAPIGRTILIKGKTFTVIGILDRINDPINYNSIDFDNTAIINYASGKEINSNTAQIQQINIVVDLTTNIDKVSDNLIKVVKTNHGGEDDFSVLIRDQISKPTNQMLELITGFSTSVAAISLIVGGVGIMNIMLVTVAERTREIGIRKALGASNSNILYQFLIESLAISFCGGVLGFAAGCFTAFIISTFLSFDPIITWQNAVIALIVSLLTGIVFGIYPAIRAARKDPIESLYQYR